MKPEGEWGVATASGDGTPYERAIEDGRWLRIAGWQAQVARIAGWQAQADELPRQRIVAGAGRSAPGGCISRTAYLAGAAPPSGRGVNAGRLRCGGSRFFLAITLRTRTTRWWMAASTQ